MNRATRRAVEKRYRKRLALEIRQLRAATICECCGSQPIDWHSFRHDDAPHLRVSSLVRVAGRQRILDEIAQCTALCRRCHMALDGRLQLLEQTRRHAPKPPKPCKECTRLYKPLRKQLCDRCYDRRRPSNHRCIDCSTPVRAKGTRCRSCAARKRWSTRREATASPACGAFYPDSAESVAWD